MNSRISSNQAGVMLPVLATVAAMASFQLGAAVAKGLFALVGPYGAAALRLLLGAVVLLAIDRPWRRWPHAAPKLPMLGLAITMAAVILLFFLAVERLPLGVAISLQFLGPLAIAVFGSRRLEDLAWAALAAGGVWCLLGANSAEQSLDPLGIAFALGAAVGWASYILLGRLAGSQFGQSTAALAVSGGALLVLPVGLIDAGSTLLQVAVIPGAILVALFSTAIPFSLEFYAMPRLPARTFAVLMSVEPAFGVLFGLTILGERLSQLQLIGVAMVIAAAAGASWSSRESTTPPNSAASDTVM